MNESQFNLRSVFFSRHGSYISFSQTDRGIPDGLYLRHLRGGILKPEVFRLELAENGSSLPFTTIATPSQLRLVTENGELGICFETADVIRFYGNQVSLQLTLDHANSPFDYALSRGNGCLDVIAYLSMLKCSFSSVQGSITIEQDWDGQKSPTVTLTMSPDANGQFDCHLHTFLSTPSSYQSNVDYEEALCSTAQDYNSWRKASLPVPTEFKAGHDQATYINWSGVVVPRGNLGRPAMFMSKNWMNKIWGWDNCFNAIAHVAQNPQLAWDQLMLFVDHQHEDGSFPDHITDNSISYCFFKPPIYGWAIDQMKTRTQAITVEHLAEIYHPLCRWTDWWFANRDDDCDGLPQYNHGNESGWDNGTSFLDGVPVESPDLYAHLILQMEFLAQTAVQLNKPVESTKWQNRAESLLKKLVDELWTGERFVARHALTHKPSNGDSLLNYMPLLLGNRLPGTIREKLIEGVQRFITPHGLATEQPDSPYYTPDGYWRGPIWAPSTYLIVDGLLVCGEKDLALEISRRFCAMATANGMAENYDALTGEGLRDRAYTWTSSVFLLLGNMLLENQKS